MHKVLGGAIPPEHPFCSAAEELLVEATGTDFAAVCLREQVDRMLSPHRVQALEHALLDGEA
eukprot:1551469-Rhodomonas_salina.1